MGIAGELDVYSVWFGSLLLVCVLLYASEWKRGHQKRSETPAVTSDAEINKQSAFKTFQWRFLAVYYTVAMADWMQV